MSRSRLLVVDDDPSMLRTARRILETKYEVTTASCATDVERLPDSAIPEIAVLDIRMPELDGFELMDRLRLRWPGVDVILMTGSLSDPDAHMIRAIRNRAFYFIEKPFDREVLTSLVDRCLELRSLRTENRRHVKRLERELEQARAFQQSMFPAVPTVAHGVRIDAVCKPCTELGGDFFDYVSDARFVAFLVADVSGHGASASLLTAMVKSAFRAAVEEAYEPGAVVARVRDGIGSFGYEKFLSCICVRVDWAKRTLEFVNAGHPPGMLADGTQVSRLMPTGPIISPALARSAWKTERRSLRGGERLLLLSDGVLETRGREGYFDEQRVVDLVCNTRAAGPGTLIESLEAALDEFSAGRPAEDDRTILTVDFPVEHSAGAK